MGAAQCSHSLPCNTSAIGLQRSRPALEHSDSVQGSVEMTDDKSSNRTKEGEPGGCSVPIKCLKVLMLIRSDRRLRSIVEQTEAQFWIWHPAEMESPVGPSTVVQQVCPWKPERGWTKEVILPWQTCSMSRIFTEL